MYNQKTNPINSTPEIRQGIVNNLKIMRISDESINRIMNAVDKMAGKDHLHGALKFVSFLTQVTDIKSKREQYFRYSKFFAEYFCTISNLGLFAVGLYYGDFFTLAAVTFSALSHAIPSQRLHDLDMLGIFLVFGNAFANYNVLVERPETLSWGVGALSIVVLDTLVSRRYLDKIGPVIHVTWHLAAALALYKLNQSKVEVTLEELKKVFSEINEVPAYLESSYQVIVQEMNNFSATSNCILL